ncbi:hypothetical protein [Kineosporia sp. NBRC 101731]|uniref:hypothetical protein n=1 Tax=Kineosporia sp. NBRC 101731 TaxID=3032199 RepID=UPI002553DFFA|nr:hypothetical protein [Kineosporia sp. NBRC 101731]
MALAPFPEKTWPQIKADITRIAADYGFTKLSVIREKFELTARADRRWRGLRAASLAAVVILAVSACGGVSEGGAGNRTSTTATSSSSATRAASATSSPGGVEGASPTVTPYAHTDVPADQVLADASEAMQRAPRDVLSSLADEILVYRSVRGPVRYARVTKSSVLTKRMKWFTDEELDGVSYLVVAPYWQDWNDRISYLLVTARKATDLREANETSHQVPADLSSLGKVQTLTQDDIDSVSDWRPFMDRVVNPSELRSGEGP